MYLCRHLTPAGCPPANHQSKRRILFVEKSSTTKRQALPSPDGILWKYNHTSNGTNYVMQQETQQFYESTIIFRIGSFRHFLLYLMTLIFYLFACWDTKRLTENVVCIIGKNVHFFAIFWTNIQCWRQTGCLQFYKRTDKSVSQIKWVI